MILVPEMKDVSLPLFDWELDKFRDFGKEYQKYVSITPLWVVLSHKREVVVIAWNVNHDTCPFLSKDNKCTVYQDRPLICRSFPVLSCGVGKYLSGENRLNIAIATSCRCYKNQEAFTEVTNISGVSKRLFDQFGESFISMAKFEIYNLYIALLLEEAIRKGKILQEEVSKSQIHHTLNKGHIRLLDFLEREKIATREEVMDGLTRQTDTILKDLLNPQKEEKK